MGRKKAIEDSELLMLIDEYFLNECNGKASRISFVNAAKYIREHGYPQVKDYIISSNPVARKHIKELKEQQDKSLTTLVTYRTLDVDDFLKKNSSKEQLTKALTALSDYYKTVADSAVTVFRKLKEYEQKMTELENALSEKDGENKNLNEKVLSLKQQNKELKDEKEKYRGVIDKYVYPEIANKLLSDEGVASLPSEHIVDEPEIITPDKEIPLKWTLLSIFDDDED